MRLKPLDYISILFSMAVTVSLAVYVYGGEQDNLRVRIKTPAEDYVYSLDTDRKIEVEGPLGTTVVRIRDGKAAIVDSPCPNKLCVQAGEQEKHGDWSACMPNKIFLQIEGGSSDGEVDAATY
ncbi:MAG TPA: NusG domain II-containing protein [Sediminispirochaeta sp.]|nr:NusG domain II-containing protein [Sediminispirochaeta sp.]